MEPVDIVRYFYFRAFQTIEPEETARPTHIRANTLGYFKKALSSYMPRRNMTWDPVRREGNPSKSTEVNEMI